MTETNAETKTKTWIFQAKNSEEPWVCGELSNKEVGAEGRVGVREGEGVRGLGQAAGGDTSIKPL